MRPEAARRCRVAAAIVAAVGVVGGASGEESRQSAPPAGPVCQAEADEADVAAAAALLERLRRSPPKRAPGAEAVVSLDNHGYAYGAPPHPLADLPLGEPR